MNKILIISKDVYCGNELDKLDIFFKEILRNSGKIIFVSRDAKILNEISDYFTDKGIKLDTMTRNEIKDFITNNKKENFIVIGNRDVDFQLSVNNKLLYIVPLWCEYIYDKSEKYGVKVKNVKQLNELIKTVNNQNNWYYHEVLTDNTEVYSLMSGMSKLYNMSEEERELVRGFEKFLKHGQVQYYDILYYHFLAAISNLEKFKEIDIWGIAPSSGKNLNKDMLLFKDRARYIMKKKFTKEGENLFIRHKAITKSHELYYGERVRLGATRHFDSININPKYKVKGKNICIFDDYLTNGNTFEAMRNMLRNAGAKKIIFVSLGRFRRDYVYQDYKLTGNVYKENGFNYELLEKKSITYKCNDTARFEVERLHYIFNL